jgi:predicted dehydrogenase
MLRYGVIGCGPVFQLFQVNSLMKAKGVKLSAVCDVDAGKARAGAALAAAKGGGKPHPYTDYHDLLRDKSIDVVVVNPQHLHVKVSVKAARAGKHVYVEKPIDHTLKGARRIIDVCRKEGVKLCVGHQRRFINIEMKARDLIRQGYLGKVFKIRVVACWYEPVENLLSKEWWHRRECGGGPLMRWGVHKTDTLRFLLEQEPVRVFAEMDTFTHRNRKVNVEDNLVALYRFGKGTIAELEVSNSQHEGGMSRGETIEIWGDKGTLWYRPSTGEMHLYSLKKTNPVNKNSFVCVTLKPDGQEMVKIHEKFVQSIEKNKRPPVTGKDGYKALEMVLASYKSASEHKPVSFPMRGAK